MELAIIKFILLYLLLPVISLLLAGVMYLIAKKNQLLNEKNLIYYFLISWVVLALPALLGFIDYWFMPYVYITLQVVYFLLGWYNLHILEKLIQISNKPYYVEFMFAFVVMFIGAAFFSLVFNLCNELQYGIWACTCLLPFIFPSVFRKTYLSFMEIPLEIYKIWSYDKQQDWMSENDFTDPNNVRVVELELFKQPSDRKAFNIKAKAAEDMPFGMWFKIFLNDYNKKPSVTPIVHTETDNPYGWIFYRITPLLGRKKHIDPDLSFAKNKIKEHWVIIAKRTRYEE